MNAAEAQVLEWVKQGILEIDEEGRIWRLAHFTRTRRLAPIERRRAETCSSEGYLKVVCMVHRKRKQAAAHRVVWMYFHGDIPDGMQINHKNCTKSDNHPDNLEIVTNAQNCQHAFAHGLLKIYRGELKANAKLTENKVRRIREAYANGEGSHRAIGERYGVSRSLVQQIVTHHAWAHVADRASERQGA
jgi:hypothetical protein